MNGNYEDIAFQPDAHGGSEEILEGAGWQLTADLGQRLFPDAARLVSVSVAYRLTIACRRAVHWLTIGRRIGDHRLSIV